MIKSDIDLIEGLLKRDPKAQQTMLDRFGRDVFVFIKVFSNIGKFNSERSSLKTWISRIAYNEAISFLRKKSTPMIYFEDYDGEALSDEEVDETFGQANKETVQLIRAALKHLPPEERALITMFYYEEMSLKDIAFVTESLPTTIASKLSRTRKKLCRIIKMLQS